MKACGPVALVRPLLVAAALIGVAGCALEPTAGGGGATIRMLAYSPTGNVLAAGGETANTIKLREGHTLAERGTLAGIGASEAARSFVRSLGFSHDGMRLLAAGIDDNVVVWDVATGRELFRREDLHGARQAALSPDGTLIAVAGPGHDGSVWRIADQRRIAVLRGHFDDVTAVAFSHRGDVIATGGADRTTRLWPLAQPEPVTLPEWHRQSVAELAFSPDDLMLASLGGDLKLWRVPNRRSIAHALEPANAAQGKSEAQALVTLLTIIASARSMQLGGGPLGFPPVGAATTSAAAGAALQVAFSPDGRMLAVLRGGWPGLGSGEIVIAEVTGNRVTRINCQCFAMAFHPDGHAIASGGEQIRFWKPDTGEGLEKP